MTSHTDCFSCLFQDHIYHSLSRLLSRLGDPGTAAGFLSHLLSCGGSRIPPEAQRAILMEFFSAYRAYCGKRLQALQHYYAPSPSAASPVAGGGSALFSGGGGSGGGAGAPAPTPTPATGAAAGAGGSVGAASADLLVVTAGPASSPAVASPRSTDSPASKAASAAQQLIFLSKPGLPSFLEDSLQVVSWDNAAAAAVVVSRSTAQESATDELDLISGIAPASPPLSPAQRAELEHTEECAAGAGAGAVAVSFAPLVVPVVPCDVATAVIRTPLCCVTAVPPPPARVVRLCGIIVWPGMPCACRAVERLS